MSALGVIREAIASRLVQDVPDINVYRFAADAPVPPCVVVYRPALIDYREEFGTTAKRYIIPVQCIVQRVDPEAADDALDVLVDDVTAAMFEDRTLGDEVESVDVVTVDNFGLVTVADVEYLACNVNLEVIV